MEFSKPQQRVYNFMRKKNVRSGVYRTPLFVLYYHYSRYCNSMRFDMVSPIEFGRRLSLYFTKGKSGRYAYYLTNIEPPPAKRRRRIRLWYDKKWARMRNGKKKKNKIP